ncbi:MAG: hypothetical protein VX393_02010 [Pseudomonadota bacterium]|nr:hypothetical protein [Pseudomonadota bacterium]
MEEFKIIYIDEDEKERRNFELTFDQPDCKLILEHPRSTLEEMIDVIVYEKPDAVICDFLLKEKEPTVNYDGADLLQGIRDKNKRLPCFLLTSYESDAIRTTLDVNSVHDKDELIAEDAEKPTFGDKVTQQIKANRKVLGELKDKISGLHKRYANGDLSTAEEREYNKVSVKIEEFIFSDEETHLSINDTSVLERLDKLLDYSDQLIKALKKR